MNLLTSPGVALSTAPGRTGYFGAGLAVGGMDKVHVRASFSFAAAAFRTRMAYRVHFVSRRNAADFDLLAGFPQMNGTTLLVGGFIGRVLDSGAFVEQQGQDVFQGQPPYYYDHTAHDLHTNRAGFILGMNIPLSSAGRLEMDIRLKQHLIPLVEEDQYFTLVFQPEQQVLSRSTRATEITIGLSYRFFRNED